MKSFKSRRTVFFVLVLVVALSYCCVLYLLSYKTLALIFAGLIFALTVLYMIMYRQLVNRNVTLVSGMTQFLDGGDRQSLEKFEIPAVLLDENFELVWYNEKFNENVLNRRKEIDSNFDGLIPEIKFLDKLKNGFFFNCDEKVFCVYLANISEKREKGFLLLYFDVTQLQKDSKELKKIRPCVMMGFYDNLDELFRDYSESQFNEMKSGLDKIVDSYLDGYDCVSRKIGSDRFLVVAHEKDLLRMREDKFDVIERIKGYKFNGALAGVSLSIGVGQGNNLAECEKNARLSLDMALSRGGDQVAIKKDDSYEFFGGLSYAGDKTHKVRSRVVASGISGLLKSSTSVFVMGHKFSDMDSIGAAIGICAVAEEFGKKAYVVCDIEKTMSKPLIEYYTNEKNNSIFIDFKKANETINEDSVLFVVDTHRKDRVEYPELLEKTKNIVIIDHHRKAVDYITNAAIFHNDPNASSSCEMVSEILPYLLDEKRLTKYEAEALMAGIMLDTKNFILRSGVRTFEAAAYLRNFGVDNILVKNLFASSAEDYKLKNNIISNAFFYKNTAICVCEKEYENIRIVASKVADELLNIENIEASFVIFKADLSVCISARSLGKINVQLIMERLGGGGHLTMAAVSFKDKDIQTVLSGLKKEIDFYMENIR